MEKDNALKYPMIAVNDNNTKHLVDNYYGTGQSEELNLLPTQQAVSLRSELSYLLRLLSSSMRRNNNPEANPSS
jgi:hypothetical protein